MRKKTLLLVDNSQVLMDLTKKILERAGYSVRCAVGITGAQEQLMDFAPDGIILESDFPDGKGLDFCRKLRKESGIPIMFLSNDKEDELPALEAGANDFLKKPFDYAIIKARINVMLNTGVTSHASGGDGERDTVVFQEAEGNERRLQSVKEETTGESVRKKKTPEAKRLNSALVVFFSFILIGIGVYNIYNNNSSAVISDEQVPLAGGLFQMDKSAKPYIGADQFNSFPSVENTEIRANATDVKILLLNPESNACYFTFEIVLADTGESLYLSDLVGPGMRIEEITLSRGLAKSKYAAIIKICAYALEDFMPMNGADVNVTLTVT